MVDFRPWTLPTPLKNSCMSLRYEKKKRKKLEILGQPISTKTIHYVDKWKKATNYCSCRFIVSSPPLPFLFQIVPEKNPRGGWGVKCDLEGRGWGGISLLECHWGELEQFALNGFEFGIREGPAAIYHVQPTTLLFSACNVLLMLLSGSKGVADPLSFRRECQDIAKS
ncbi:uncharacterized protein TNCV_2974231 [Trichonephila clavipes]|nr:uncharacterized protein TNCV_2974231 [Trichonephila clavipes]